MHKTVLIYPHIRKDIDARYGHNAVKEGTDCYEIYRKVICFWIQTYADADAETEMPLAVEIAPANRHDKTFFHILYSRIKTFRIG
ncbi:MAG: hypothetical protein QXS81_02690 [Candidatus Micrarchaeaceae archaeon]